MPEALHCHLLYLIQLLAAYPDLGATGSATRQRLDLHQQDPSLRETLEKPGQLSENRGINQGQD